MLQYFGLMRRLPGKDPDVGKVQRQEEKGVTEDEMVGQCHRSYQYEFDPTPGGSGRQEGLACSDPWGHKESDTTKRLNNNKSLLFAVASNLQILQKGVKQTPIYCFHLQKKLQLPFHNITWNSILVAQRCLYLLSIQSCNLLYVISRETQLHDIFTDWVFLVKTYVMPDSRWLCLRLREQEEWRCMPLKPSRLLVRRNQSELLKGFLFIFPCMHIEPAKEISTRTLANMTK